MLYDIRILLNHVNQNQESLVESCQTGQRNSQTAPQLLALQKGRRSLWACSHSDLCKCCCASLMAKLWLWKMQQRAC